VLAREIEEITSFEPSDSTFTVVFEESTANGPLDEIGRIVAANWPST
jgi:hypothetical protein